MTHTSVRYALAVGLMLLTAVASSAAEPSKVEQKLRENLAGQVARFAEWCAGVGAARDGAAALEEAKTLDPGGGAGQGGAVRSAEEALEGVEEDDGSSTKVDKQRGVVGPKIAKLYDKLAATKHAEEDAARFEDYRFRAVFWDPSSGRVKKLLAALRKDKDPFRRARGLAKLRRSDPTGDGSGRYDAAELAVVTKGLAVLGSPDSDLLAYVSLPGKWKKGGKYHVLVAVDGAGCGFKGCAGRFAGTRGKRDFIVVSPITFSNTNTLKPAKYPYPKATLDAWDGKRMEFDYPGVEGILKILRARYGAREKVFLTGFSGGGNYTYYKLLTDPEQVAGAAPACANYGKQGRQGAESPQDGGPPVHLMTGAKDPHRDATRGKPPGIETQTDWIETDLKDLGYSRVKRTMWPNAKHQALQTRVWDFIDQVLADAW